MSNQDIKINPGFLPQKSFESLPPGINNPNSTANSNALLHSPCSSCGFKRRSPDSPLFPVENPKKLLLQPEQNTPPAFSKISLDYNQDYGVQIPNSLPILRRCFSDPCKPPSSTAGKHIPVTQPPPQTTPLSKGTASLPPRPPVRRCLSDLSEFNKSCTLNSSAKDMSVDESQWRKRMRACVKEMKECWNGPIIEKKEEQGNVGNSNLEKEDSLGLDSEETVRLERRGDCVIVHVKCCCSNDFKILVRGTDCYYKLD